MLRAVDRGFDAQNVLSLCISVTGALLATRGLSNFLFGVSPFDLGIFAAVTGVLLGAAVVASFVPALRSARVDPKVALRLE